MEIKLYMCGKYLGFWYWIMSVLCKTVFPYLRIMFLKWRLNRFIKSIDGSLFSFINQNMFKKSLFGALKKFIELRLFNFKLVSVQVSGFLQICITVPLYSFLSFFIFFLGFSFRHTISSSESILMQTLKVISDQ